MIYLKFLYLEKLHIIIALKELKVLQIHIRSPPRKYLLTTLYSKIVYFLFYKRYINFA